MPATTTVLDERYELGAVLGRGGMARVYEGRDRKLDRKVAVKVLSHPYDRDEAYLERFRREAHAAARLNHPNVVAIFDSESDDGTHYIVTELVDGETLAGLLARERSLSPERAVGIATQVSRGLAAAHERGVVHRDIKPGNVMLTSDHHVKVLDFGIARATGVESLTRTGHMLGSASYLSPEQSRGEPGDARSDIYAMGCVLFEMLTGRPPFVADSPVAALYQHVNEPVVPPSTLVSIPPSLEDVVLRCLGKDPADRFASAEDLAGALGEVEVARSGTTMPLPSAELEETAPIRRIEETPPPARLEEAAVPATVPDRSPPSSEPRWRSGWRVAGFVVLGLLVLGAMGLAFEPVELPSRAELRQQAQAAREQEQSPVGEAEASPSVSESPPQVFQPTSIGEAYEVLLGTIGEALGSGQIEEHVGAKLHEKATEVLQELEEGDAEGMRDKLDEVAEELAEAVEHGDVSIQAAERIDGALAAFELAIVTEFGTGTSDGDGDEDEGDD